MLLITRKENETVLIGDNIRVMVVKVWGKQVRLGIEAPPGVSIKRNDAEEKAEDDKD